MNNKNAINRENYNNPKYITCLDCEYTRTCPRFDECSYLLSQNHLNDREDDDHIAKIKATTAPLPYDKFHMGKRDPSASYDHKEPIFTYHRKLVNEALSIIRKGGTAYAYTDQVLKDILKFEPTASVSKQDNIYYIRIINS